MEASLLNLENVLRTYGRGVVFYKSPAWDGISPITLTHLGDTEGEIVMNPNQTVAGFTLPELTGPAVHEADYLGENPVVEIPLFLADPALLTVVSPTGAAGAGYSRRRPVATCTLVLFPEELFRSASDPTGAFEKLSYDGEWKVGGVALNEQQERLLGNSIWFWRGYFSRPSRRFRGGAGDEKKNIETVTFTAMYHSAMPEGHRIYTQGDPSKFGIDLDPAGS